MIICRVIVLFLVPYRYLVKLRFQWLQLSKFPPLAFRRELLTSNLDRHIHMNQNCLGGKKEMGSQMSNASECCPVASEKEDDKRLETVCTITESNSFGRGANPVVWREVKSSSSSVSLLTLSVIQTPNMKLTCFHRREILTPSGTSKPKRFLRTVSH